MLGVSLLLFMAARAPDIAALAADVPVPVAENLSRLLREFDVDERDALTRADAA